MAAKMHKIRLNNEEFRIPQKGSVCMIQHPHPNQSFHAPCTWIMTNVTSKVDMTKKYGTWLTNKPTVMPSQGHVLTDEVPIRDRLMQHTTETQIKSKLLVHTQNDPRLLRLGLLSLPWTARVDQRGSQLRHPACTMPLWTWPWKQSNQHSPKLEDKRLTLHPQSKKG